jgi:phosphodiesterase/alkaline phosphatase D-like protein
MSDRNGRVYAGPFCGALTESGAKVKASVPRNVMSAAVLVAENPAFTGTVRRFSDVKIFYDAELGYKNKILSAGIDGLESGKRYHYRFELDGEVDTFNVGEFKTLAPRDTRASFRFACGSCGNYRSFFFILNEYPEVYRAIAAEPDLSFFYHLGDLHYENIGAELLKPRFEAYDEVARREGPAALFAKLPFVYVWDDHDFLGNDSTGNTNAGEYARRAFDLYMPHYTLASPEHSIALSFVVGRVLFVQTDARSRRSYRKDDDTPAKTMLGPTQKDWLKQRLLEGKQYDLTVWINSVPWIGKPEKKEDYWAGYTTERGEIARFVKENAIRNLCMISGDAHMLAADTGKNNGYAPGNKGGFPVLQAASIESDSSEKGGPYTHGGNSGFPGPRQYAVVDVRYQLGPNGALAESPQVTWTGRRVDKNTGKASDVFVYRFDGHKTYDDF